MPMFCQKICTLSKKRSSHVIFFKFFMKNPFLSCPYLVKNVNSVKTTLYYKPKNSIRPPFVRIYIKSTALMPIFYQKTSILKKHIVLTPIFCKKMSIRSKTRCSRVIFKILMKNPCCNSHI